MTVSVSVSVAHTLVAMMAREVRVLRRNFVSTAVRVLLQPVLFVLVFAYILPEIGSGVGIAAQSGQTSFSTVLVPGLIGSTVFTQAMMSVIAPLMTELSWPRSIDDRLLAPLPVRLLAAQKIVTGAALGLTSGLLVVPAVLLIHAPGQAPAVRVHDIGLLVAVMVLGSLLAASLGLVFGTILGPRQVQVLFTVVTLPMIMLGCVYFPWSGLVHVPWLRFAVLFNPMVYVNEGLRAALTPQVGHLPTPAFLVALVGATVVLLVISVRVFDRRVTK